jgi:multidrug resistance protein, MATE family
LRPVGYDRSIVLRAELKPTLRLAGPVILAELGWMGMGIVDTIMVGPLGPAAIGAAGVGNSLHLGFAIFGMGLLLGLDTLVSQAYGAGQLALCRAWLRRGVQLAIISAAPLMLVLAAVWWLVPQLGFHPDTRPLLQGYFAVVILSTPFLLLYAALRRYLQSTHHVAPVMFALVSANAINAFFNWVFIYGKLGVPALGVPGAAWATFAARGYMCAVLAAAVWWTWREGSPGPARTAAGRPPTSVRRLVDLGLPAAATVTAEVGVFAVATALAGSLEPVATASHQIALNIAAVAFMIPLGLASAGAVRVGNAVGARNPSGAAAAGWTVIAIGVAFMLFSGAVFIAPAPAHRAVHPRRGGPGAGRVTPFHRRGVPAVRWIAGRRHRDAARPRRHADADGHKPGGALADRPADRLLAVLLRRLGRARPVVGPVARPDRGRRRADDRLGALGRTAADVRL